MPLSRFYDKIIGFDVPAEHKTRKRKPEEFVEDLDIFFSGMHIRKIRMLHISADLHPRRVEVLEESRQLQCRTVNVRIRYQDLVRIDLRCIVFQIQLFYKVCQLYAVFYRHIIPPPK